jgi:hypothetical protein
LPEGWKWVRLGEVCKITTGEKDVNEGNSEGEYYFLLVLAYQQEVIIILLMLKLY